MYKIVKSKELTTNIYLMEVEAKRVAKACQPGQFVIVRTDEEGERIPLTICDYDREKGTVTIVFQCVGALMPELVSEQEVPVLRETVLFRSSSMILWAPWAVLPSW